MNTAFLENKTILYENIKARKGMVFGISTRNVQEEKNERFREQFYKNTSLLRHATKFIIAVAIVKNVSKTLFLNMLNKTFLITI